MAVIQSAANGAIRAGINAERNLHASVFPRCLYSYQLQATSGSIAASTAAASVLFTFKNFHTSNHIVLKGIYVGLQVVTAYTKGSMRMSLWPIRPLYLSQGITNATYINNSTVAHSKKRKDHDFSGVLAYICTTTGITGDSTAARDSFPMSTICMDQPGSISNMPLTGLATLYQQTSSESPYILEPNEGFRIENDTAFAATGAAALSVRIEYDEIVEHEH